jgi:uncharacterized membrane protein YhaH (DUF805 family)
MRWYFQALRKYAVFAGRARRKEYWVFELAHFPIIVALVFVGKVIHSANLGLLPSLYILAVLIPSLASLVRRLHDTNRSGWWVFINLVPLVGPLIILSFTVTNGNTGANRFGPDPKIEASAEANTQASQMGYLAPPLPPERR